MKDQMAVITVEMWENASLEQKRQIVQDITGAFMKHGIPAENVSILMRENPRSCWAVSGKLCSDFRNPG